MKIAATCVAVLAAAAATLLPARADPDETLIYPSPPQAELQFGGDEQGATISTISPSPPGSFSSCDASGLLSQTESVVDAWLNCAYDTSPPTSTEQKFARCYLLADEGCTTTRVIDSVQFGVHSVIVYDPYDEPVKLRVNIYEDAGCLTGNPGTGGTLVATVDTEVTPDDDSSLVTVEICSDVEILPSEAIRVEVEVESGWYGYERFNFRPGFTAFEAASGPTYYLSPCTGDVFVDLAVFDGGRFAVFDFVLDVHTSPAPTGRGKGGSKGDDDDDDDDDRRALKGKGKGGCKRYGGSRTGGSRTGGSGKGGSKGDDTM